MANYYASARSNKFKVKDIQKFKESMHPSIDVEVLDEKEGLVLMYVDDPDGSGWPNFIYDEEDDEYVDWEISGYVQIHLKDDEWCVLQEVGAEKLRYLVGYSVAFNNKGEEFNVNLEDIYKHLPDNVSSCMY